MSDKKFDKEKQLAVNVIKGIEGRAEGKSERQIVQGLGRVPAAREYKELVTTDKNQAFEEALEELGVDISYVAEKLRVAMEAFNIRKTNKGTIIKDPDNKTRLKAMELWAQIVGVTGPKVKPTKEGDKHIHLHGKTKDELDELLSIAQTRKD